MKISIIGTGYVGLVTGACLASKGHRVICLDVDESKIESLKKGIVPIFEPGLEDLVRSGIESGFLSFTTDKALVSDSQVVFLCVGTPAKEDGSADLSFVFQAVDDIAPHISDSCVVVSKSTVPVGTSKNIHSRFSCHSRENGNPSVLVSSNPEFLREGSAVSDFLNPDRIVIGANDESAFEVLRNVYKDFDCPKLETTLESAEMIKYASNAFLATKISFINEIANVCEQTGADVLDVAKGMGLDPRIGSSFLKAGLGYGGSCFPKDVRALNQIAGSNGYDFKLLKAVIEVNNEQRWRFYNKILKELTTPSVLRSSVASERQASSPLPFDYAQGTLRNRKVSGGEVSDSNPLLFKEGVGVVNVAVGAYEILKGLNIAILGLAFKANTDDIRESIGIDYAKKFMQDGAKVSVYDSHASDNARRELDGAVLASTILEAVKDADAVVITTDAQEFVDVDWKQIHKLMRGKYIFDGRNVLGSKELESIGFSYSRIGN
ncbi:UDP-glucose/GDP-mannose dehydrogenase family protein [Patescibacteria group bacterium]|nr:UDP-glucose/GDP-mannose dehydrogenase family protein [Patescibacteria group bacterium]MBU4452670.1 UDP-glucose/GDP-mannose dehydrogenase family protein [Patescibacteria group bacterium]MCG2687955.1 UDP-glucose/GDP-mannose dehydrogenase family protein [Candidatus Parcubacteria bacterium]